jgi:hypothetical protein
MVGVSVYEEPTVLAKGLRCSICGTLILIRENDTQRQAIYKHYKIEHPDIIALLTEEE